jgi:hypothetical protein
VFDNIEDINDLNAYLPTGTRSRGAVIITIQKSNFFPISDVFKKIEVCNFGREEGSDLLFKYLERDTDNVGEDGVETARQISDILGGIPLAIAKDPAKAEGTALEKSLATSRFH